MTDSLSRHPLPCDLLVRAEIIVTQDSERTIIRDGGMAIAGGRISAVGPWCELEQNWNCGRLLDLGPAMVLPGLVNTHTHNAMTLFRGLADDLPLMEWLENHIFPVEQHHTPETVRLGARLACAEYIRTGTTCFNDMYYNADQVADAAREMGMRGLVSEAVIGFPTPAWKSPRECFEKTRRLAEYLRDDPLVGLTLSAHACYTTDPETMQESFALAEEYGCLWQMHLAETPVESSRCSSMYGKRPVPFARDIGILGPRTVIAHGVDLTDEDIAILAETGTGVVHNPESNMKLASGICRVPDLSGAGVCVSLGTDGAASNNNLNLFTEMTSAALLQKVARRDPTALPAPKVLDMATRNGACNLGLADEIGSLETGKSADFIALDLNHPSMLPLYNPVSQAVYAATGGEVRLTAVAGKVLFEDGRFTTVDYEGLLKEVAGYREWVLERYK